MIEKREEEWQKLEAKALQMLENPRLLPKDETIKHFIPILHLWIAPTFTPHKHWVFCKARPQVNPQPKPIVRQLIWQRNADFQRLNNPLIGLQEGFHIEPTFEIRTIEIDNEKLKNLHEDLTQVQFSAFIKDENLGLDGEHFGVETLDFYHNAKVSWWSSYPEEWKELVNWFEKIRKFLEEEFGES